MLVEYSLQASPFTVAGWHQVAPPLETGREMFARLLLIVAVSLACTATLAEAGGQPPRRLEPRPVVVAIVGEAGANVLHEDFRSRAPIPPLPAGTPATTRVDLPNTGTFEQQLVSAQAGPLGRIPQGQLLQIAGTHLLVYNAESQPTSMLGPNRSHGTAVLGAAASRRSGSAPNAIYVFVLGNGRAWDWVAEQRWIDVATTSVNSPVGGGSGHGPVADSTCSKGAGVRRSVENGKLVLSAGGNGDPSWHLSSPAALPEVLRVGGHQADGSASPLPTRPYEVSDLILYDGPSADALTGTQNVIGTSFASPRAAGRAAQLLQDSRQLLRDVAAPARPGLAVQDRRTKAPASGPLADGVLTNTELRSLLQDTAIPRVEQPEARYAQEGFGLLGDEQMNLSRQVLRGTAKSPDRSVERGQHQQAQQLRALITHPARCG